MGEIVIKPIQNVHKKYREMNLVNPYIFGSSFDADAQAFITNAGLIDSIQKTAINNLVVSLKSAGLWTKMKAVYPLIGGTAFTHKWNLKDPRDLDVAFRLGYFNGTITHNSQGITGTNVSCNTYVNSLINLSGSDNHLSNYCSTDTSGAMVDMGSGDSSSLHALYQSFIGNLYSDNTSSYSRISAANTLSKGFYIGTRTANNSHKAYKNGTQIAVSTATITPNLPNGPIYLLSSGFGTPYYSNRTYSWFSIGSGLTDSDASNLYTIIQAYQTALGRQV